MRTFTPGVENNIDWLIVLILVHIHSSVIFLDHVHAERPLAHIQSGWCGHRDGKLGSLEDTVVRAEPVNTY